MCRYSVVSGDTGALFTPSAPQHHRVPLGSCQERFCFHPGTCRHLGGGGSCDKLTAVKPSPIMSSQVNCISTEFTPRKHGGEKGVPFRIQVDTFTTNEHGEYMEHVHSSSCQVKVFKVRVFSACLIIIEKSNFGEYIYIYFLFYGSLKELIAN